MIRLEVKNTPFTELFVVLQLLKPLGLSLDLFRKLAHERRLTTLCLDLELVRNVSFGA